MDADCLIKFTKAGLKDLVVNKDTIFIPKIVQKEVVDSGKDKGLPDALVVEKNINAKKITIVKASSHYSKGDYALIHLFKQEKYDAVATDDAKLIRMLKMNNIPFIVPALIIYKLLQRKIINNEFAFLSLKKLAEYISEDEYSTVKLLMEKIK
jgi:rRNA-processing protein FCF1